MKVKLIENEGCFAIDLEAETVQDAAAIARLGLMALKEVRGIYAYPYQNGSFTGSVVIGKSKNRSDYIRLA